VEEPLTGSIDLRADVDRDGVVSIDGSDDDDGEEGWSAARGAVFLANLDDDEERCPEEMFPAVTPDVTLAACHDAADEVVNGAADLLDLARLRSVPWAEAPDGVVGAIVVTPAAAAARVRVFRRAGAGFEHLAPGATLSAAELRAGVELAVEATDVVRDRAVWDGFADVTLEVRRAGSTRAALHDRVRLRVAPIVFPSHAEPAEQVFVTRLVMPARPDDELASTAFVAEVESASEAAELPHPVYAFAMRDRWMQDLFEIGHMTMPAAGGGQQVMRVAIRTAEVRNPGGPIPLRVEGRIVFFLRGLDMAALQEFDPAGIPEEMATLNSFGNTEVIPPHERDGASYPLGRLLRGSVPTFYPDPRLARLLEAQAVQPPVHIDTSWLNVAHVDETLAFLPAPTPRGWILLANDPGLARRMLLELEAAGHGDARLFTGRSWRAGAPAEVSVSALLADVDVMTESAKAAAEVEAQLEILRAATGIGDGEIVRVPFLHHAVAGRAVAYQPGTVNLLALRGDLVAAPDPLGPIVDGKDVFKEQLEEALAAHGIAVRWIDVWDLLHRNLGEVHCGTNALRAAPAARWWEGGR
jgi:protein-arginine deiminase